MTLSIWMRRALLSSVTLGALATVAGPGCIKKNPSAVVLQIESDLTWPGNLKNSSSSGDADLNSITLTISRDGNEHGYNVDLNQTLPATFVIWNDPDQDRPLTLESSVTVEAQGINPKRPFKIVYQASLGFSSEETKIIHIKLAAACADISQPQRLSELCNSSSDTQTCQVGACQNISQRVESLKNYPEPVVDTGQVCFDDSLDKCFAGAKSYMVVDTVKQKMSRQPCTFPVRFVKGLNLDLGMNATNPNLNVAFQWQASGSRYLVADRDNSGPRTGTVADAFWKLQTAQDGSNPEIAVGALLCTQLMALGDDGTLNGVAIVLSNNPDSACKSKIFGQDLCHPTPNDPALTATPAPIKLDMSDTPTPTVDCTISTLTLTPACQTCVTSNMLKPALAACNNSEGCAARVACAQACAGDPTCTAGCQNAAACAGKGTATALEFYTALKAKCGTECTL